MVRKNTGVTLTSAGQVLLGYSESITRKMKNMVNEMNSLSCSSVVDVSFGYPSLIGFTFLPEMIKTAQQVFPAARSPCLKPNCRHFYRRCAMGD